MRQGEFGERYWRNPEDSKRLFYPQAWKMLFDETDFEIAKSEYQLSILVHSYTKGGFPITATWNVTVNTYDGKTWKIVDVQ